MTHYKINKPLKKNRSNLAWFLVGILATLCAYILLFRPWLVVCL